MTIFICAGILLLAIISIVQNPLLWVPLKKNKEEEEATESLPPLSVVIRLGDDTCLMERNLPLLLQQDYAAGYEIILVANEGDTDADELMKRYKDEARLRSTFIPKTSRYISREKLGITLGIKAANNDWCLLMDGNCYPESNLWLKEMGKGCKKDMNLVIGPSDYNHESYGYQRFYRLRRFCMIWFEAMHSIPFASNYSNLCIRKSEFIKDYGYRGNLECVRGEYDFLVNKYARKNSTAMITSIDAMLREDAPTAKQWHRRRVFYLHSCKLMKRRILHSLFPCTDAIILFIACIATICAIAFGSLTHDWFILGSGVLAMLLIIVMRTLINARAVSFYNAGISFWKLPWIEFTTLFHAISDKIRFRFANQTDFTCHKL